MATLVVSYSRVDRPQVRAVVALLKAALRGVDRAVFWDEDFEPGEPWFDQLCQHIDAAPQLFVFWCAHAANSPQVRREFSYAMQRSKRVVPVLMDNTALVPELAQIHGIDLRDALQHRESPPGSPAAGARPSPARAAATGRLVAIYGALALGVAIAVGTIRWTLSSIAPGPGGGPNETPPLPQASGAGALPYVLLIAGAIALFVMTLVMLRARRKPHRTSPPPAADALPAIPSWRRERIISAFEPFIPDGRSGT